MCSIKQKGVPKHTRNLVNSVHHPSNTPFLTFVVTMQAQSVVYLIADPRVVSLNPSSAIYISVRLFVCIEVLRPSQPNGVMSGMVS